ncbi:MAG: PKD domain-containing protein [Thermoleophilaceae bacterium]|nr:PKD domain-containing protein [Thermoleophilaceae bacterium]
MKKPPAPIVRRQAHLSLATAKLLVPVITAGTILLASQLVMAAAPEADFGFTPTVAAVNQQISFDATVQDPDDDVVSIEWDFDNDGSFDATGGNVQHSFGSSGSKTVRMVVTDAASETDEVVHALRVNAPPGAAFEFSPSNPSVNQSIAFDARGTTDDAAIGAGGFDWDLDGDGAYDDGSGAQLSHSYATPGTRTVGLRVTDSDGETSFASHSVQVAALNAGPTAAFSFGPSRPNVGQTVSFDGSESDDDGPLLPTSYAWDLDGDGAFDDALGVTPSTSYSSSGPKTVSLRVTDALGVTDTASHSFTVNPPPNASFSVSPASADVGDPVSFDAAASSDDLPLPANAYAWDLDNDGAFDDGTAQTASTTFSTPGGKTVRLRVTDSGGSTDIATQTVSVAANPAPVAAFSFTPARPNIAQAVALTGAGSSDDEPIPAGGYSWDTNGDGVYGDVTGVTTSTSFATAGAKTVGLRVTDADGAMTSTTQVITVNAAPTADFTFTPASPSRTGTGTATVTYNGTAQDDLALPAAALAWDTDNDGQFDDGTTNQVTATYATSGAKIVRFRVTDSGGSVTTVQKTVTVNTIPVADFTITPQTPRLNEAMTLRSTSTDADAGQALTVTWDTDNDGQFDDGTGATLARAGYTSVGEKVMRMRVVDTLGATAIRERRVTVQDRLPTAGLTWSPAVPLPGQTVTFRSTSTPSQGASITATEWNLDAISGFERPGITATAVFRTAGRHTVEVKVSEDSGGVDIESAVVVVNAAPTALMRFSSSQPYAGDTVNFASVSRDSDGNLTSETWDLDGDGQYDDATGKLASRRFTTLGAHTVRLRAVDNHGAGSVHAVTINVRERPKPAPEPEQLDAVVRISSVPGKSFTRISRLGVRAGKGAMVRASCKGKGCPAKRASSTRSRGKAVRLRWLERRLWPGTRIRIYVTAKGKVGSYTSLLIRRAKSPSRLDRCLSPGTTKTIRCPR